MITESFIYLDRNFGTHGGLADLFSIQFGPSSATCQMEFYYYLTGATSLLRVSLEVGSETSIIWMVGTDQGERWMHAIVNIMHISEPFRVHIQGLRDTNIRGIVAVDDISFINCNFPVPGSCDGSQNQFQCQNRACVPMVSVCDYTDDCGDGSDETQCSLYPVRTDFEQSFGTWSQDVSGADNFDWSRMHGTTSTSSTGPGRDHTRGTMSGYYAYIESSLPRVRGDKAWLVSTSFNPTTSATCTLRLYYHMYGSTIGSLNIYTRNSQLGALKLVASLSGNYGDAWQRKDVQFQERSNFQVNVGH